MSEATIVNALKSYINMNLKEALFEAIANNLEDKKGYFPIIIEGFLNNPLYTEFLSNHIAVSFYEYYKPQCRLASTVQDLCSRITKEDIAKRALLYHSFAYQDLMNIRRSEMEESKGRK